MSILPPYSPFPGYPFDPPLRGYTISLCSKGTLRSGFQGGTQNINVGLPPLSHSFSGNTPQYANGQYVVRTVSPFSGYISPYIFNALVSISCWNGLPYPSWGCWNSVSEINGQILGNPLGSRIFPDLPITRLLIGVLAKFTSSKVIESYGIQLADISTGKVSWSSGLVFPCATNFVIDTGSGYPSDVAIANSPTPVPDGVPNQLLENLIGAGYIADLSGNFVSGLSPGVQRNIILATSPSAQLISTAVYSQSPSVRSYSPFFVPPNFGSFLAFNMGNGLYLTGFQVPSTGN